VNAASSVLNQTSAGTIFSGQLNGVNRLQLTDTTLVLRPQGTTGPQDSVPIEMVALNLSSVEQKFQWQTLPGAPEGRLSLRYASGSNTPSDTGLWFREEGSMVLGEAVLVQPPNDPVTGTTQNRVAKFTSAGVAVLPTTSDTGGLIGIVRDGAGTTGQAQVGVLGVVDCEFDGPVTVGNYVQLSTTLAGACHDAGATYPTSGGQIIGRAVEPLMAPGIAGVYIFGTEIRGAAGGGGGSGDVTDVLATAGGGITVTNGAGPQPSVGLISTCATNQILKWNGTAWACAADVDTNSGGTVTSVSTGIGLTGGPVTSVGTISLNTIARTRAITYLAGCETCDPLADTDDQPNFFFNTIGTMTIQSITCFSDAGNPTINVQSQDAGGSMNLLATDLTCSPTGATALSFTDNQLLLNDRLNFLLQTLGGTPRRITLNVTAVIN
jgi:hypothetical protein